MKKKINIYIIFLVLVLSATQVFADSVQTDKANEPKKTVKSIFVFKKNNTDKNSQAEAIDKTSDNDTVFTPSAIAKKEEKIKEKKNFLEHFKKKNISEKAAPNVEVKKEEVVKTKEDNAPIKKTKLQKVKDENKKVNSKDEINIKDSKTVEGAVATNRIISIDDCIKIALENHPAIQSAMSSTDIYKSKIAQAWSAYFPKLGLDANYSRNDMLINNFAFPNQKYGSYALPKLTAETLLFDFGKAKSSANISEKIFEASKNNLQMSINEVIFNVKKEYFNLLFAIQQQEVIAETVRNFEIHLKQAQAFYTIGTKAKIDVMTAEYNLGKAKLDYIKAKNNVALAYAQVSAALGIPEFANYTIVDKLESKAYNIDFNEILETAYSTRPELLAAKKKAEASEILIKASVRAFAPDVVAFGNYTLGGTAIAKDYGYQLGAGLTYKSTNLFLLKKQVDESKATYKRDFADYQNQKQKVYLEVKQAYIQLYNAQDSIPVARMSVKRAKEQYDLASGRYKVGLGDAIELKDAENTYRNAQLDYYNTLLNYNVAAANIERVIGAPVKPSEQSLI